MESNEREKPVYVTFSPASSGENVGMVGFLWFMTKHFGFISQKLNPVISIFCFFISALIAHHYGLGLWSLAVGLAIAVLAWFIGGGLIYWSIFTALAGLAITIIGYLLYLFFSHIAG